MSAELRDAVFAYVENGIEKEKADIVKLNQWTTLTSPRTVYRGQSGANGEKDPSKMSLFSVTENREIALNEFSGQEGCVWSLRMLPGVQIIDVNAVLGHHRKEDEAELLVKGGGDMKFVVTRDPICKISATYGPPLKTVTIETLKQRALEIGDDLSETIDDFRLYLNTGEVLKAGRRKKKTRSKKSRKNKTNRRY